MVYSLVQRWKKAHVVFECLQLCKNGSLEYALNPSHGSTISKPDFIRCLRREFDIKDPLVETHLARFHDSFNCARPKCYDILCTYKTIVHAEFLINDPRRLLNIFCDICSDDKGRIHVDEIKMILYLGSDEIQLSQDVKGIVDDFLTNIKCQLQVVDKNVFKNKLLDLHPTLITQFRTNVWSKIPDLRRRKVLTQMQVR